MSEFRWMLYGAYGFTGRLIAREAVRRGHRPLLSGRNREKLEALGSELELDTLPFSLKNQTDIISALRDTDLVANIAGPYTHTAIPVVNACLQTGTHYLDVCGELHLFSELYSRDSAARSNGIVVLPGCGFDVVPTDSMAAYLKDRMPEAIHIELAIDSSIQPSAGTAKAATEVIARGGYVREQGKLVKRQLGERGPNIRFHRGERPTLVAPFADLESAWRTTGVPNITTYLALHPGIGFLSSLAGLGTKVLAITPLRRVIAASIDLALKGKQENREGETPIWGRATDEKGGSIERWMRTPEPYHYTAETVVNAVERLKGTSLAGALTPTEAFGQDFALLVEGAERGTG